MVAASVLFVLLWRAVLLMQSQLAVLAERPASAVVTKGVS